MSMGIIMSMKEYKLDKIIEWAENNSGMGGDVALHDLIDFITSLK